MKSTTRVFVPFFVASLGLTLTWGTTLGMINLARLTAGWGLGALPRPSVWAHAYVQVFGFIALFVMGVAYHVLPRFVGGELRHSKCVPWSFWLQFLGVVVIACGFLHDAAFTQLMWLAGSSSLLASSVLFCVVVLATLKSGVPVYEPFRWWIAAGVLWLVASSALALVAAVANDVTWHRVLWTAALFGFVSSWFFGVGRRILPIFLGCRPRWNRIEPSVFWMYQLGALLWTLAAWREFDHTGLRAAAAALIIPSVIAYTACLGLFTSAVGRSGLQRYVFAAWTWLFTSLVLGPGWTLLSMTTGADERLLVIDFARHAMAFGFGAQMVLGVASRVVPNFTGKPLWSPGAREASFYLLNASMAFRALELPIAFGFLPGAWSSIAWSGPLGLAALVLFTVNLVMTVCQPGVAVLQPVVPTHALQPVRVQE